MRLHKQDDAPPVLEIELWGGAMPDAGTVAGKLKAAGTKFVIEPYTRFKGEPGEQATMFLLDPAGNALEFKAMADPAKLFAKN